MDEHDLNKAFVEKIRNIDKSSPFSLSGTIRCLLDSGHKNSLSKYILKKNSLNILINDKENLSPEYIDSFKKACSKMVDDYHGYFKYLPRNITFDHDGDTYVADVRYTLKGTSVVAIHKSSKKCNKGV